MSRGRSRRIFVFTTPRTQTISRVITLVRESNFTCYFYNMMALKLLPLLQVIIILCSPSRAYPAIYGTKRYGRTPLHASNTWPTSTHVQPYQQMVRTQRYPLNYYEMYPYNQNYEDYYYPHDSYSYPIYYPRTSKYEVYQAVLPYYYDRPLMRSGFYYGYDDNADAVGDMDDEILQEAEREQREESQPIGQEMYYENDNANYNDVNAAFLQNLIMSQMYKDSLDYTNDDIYGKLDEYPPPNFKEDEDVKELKQLAKPVHEDKLAEERQRWFQRATKKPRKYEEKRNNLKTYSFSERKAPVTAAPSTTTVAPKRESRGQKEEVLFRPAAPIKHPFNSPVLNNMLSKKDRQRTPSVYDTIKHMLDMEKSLETENDLKPAMRKRIISSEDSLTHQLSILKKQM